MHLEGLMHQVPTWDIIAGLYQHRKTGILTLQAEAVERVLYIQEGSVVFARSNVLDERLGEQLVRLGFLSYRNLEECSRLIRPGHRLGMILVEQGLLTPDQLVRSVIAQVRVIVHHAFSMDEGRFIFDADATLPSEVITLNIPMPLLIYQATQAIHSWTIIQRSIGPLTTVYMYDREQRSMLISLDMSEEIRSWLDRFTAPVTLETMLSTSPVNNFVTGRILVGLLALRVLRRMDQPQSAFDIMITGAAHDDTSPMPGVAPTLVNLDLDLTFSDLVDLVDHGGIPPDTLRYLPKFQPPDLALARFKCRHRYLWSLLRGIFGDDRALFEIRRILTELMLENPGVWLNIDVEPGGEISWGDLETNLIVNGQRPYSDDLEPFLNRELELLKRCLNEDQLRLVLRAVDDIHAAFVAEPSE